MHIKFLNHSKGSGRDAVRYLLGERDSKGEARADVQVLRGNPEQVGQLIDSLNFVSRYTSGVIAFHHDDDPTDAEIDRVLRDFEAVAFAGLQPNQYTWSAVLHQESDGSKHVHVIVPRVDLVSGKSMNIAPPGWQRTFDPLRDALNYEHGWARPDDPRLARLVRPGPSGTWPGWKSGEDVRQQVTGWLTDLVASGHVSSRQDVLDALGRLGQVTRAGKDYISIRVEGAAKPVRLKGALFHEQFSSEAIGALAATDAGRPAGRDHPDQEAARIARAGLEEVVRRRAAYNASRYRTPEPSAGRAAQRDAQAPAVADALAASGQPRPISRDRGRVDVVEPVEARPGAADRQPSSGAGAGAARPDAASFEPVLPDSSGQADLQQGVTDDRAREVVERAIDQARRVIRDAVQAVERCAAAAGFAYQRTVAACRSADETTPILRRDMDAELERFKSDLSLSDYAQNCGYELVKKESSANSKVLKGQDGSKIVVARGRDGHDIYFNVGDDRDNGSIIDFVQRQHGFNLGQVRRELRGWLPGAKRPAPEKPDRAPDRPVVASKDRVDVLRGWLKMKPYSGHYLTDERSIDPAIIKAFDVRQDERGNMCAAHKDGDGLVGWEVKNKGFTGFSSGGSRGLCYGRLDSEPIKRIVITESVIDAMSYAQMRHAQGDVYISLGGALSAQQKDLLARLFERLPRASVVLATDNDEAGERMAQEVGQLAMAHGIKSERQGAPTGKDWNDALRFEQAAELERQRYAIHPGIGG